MSARGGSGHADASEAEPPFVYPTPRAGRVLIRESCFRHGVPVNAAKSDCISIRVN